MCDYMLIKVYLINNFIFETSLIFLDAMACPAKFVTLNRFWKNFCVLQKLYIS